MRDSILTGKEVIMRCVLVIPSTVAATSLSVSSVGDSFPPSGLLTILDHPYVFALLVCIKSFDFLCICLCRCFFVLIVLFFS